VWGLSLAQEVSKWASSPELPSRGLVQVFTGDGKGKTTAALGAVIRALGQGRRAYIVFFMKGQYPYGERKILARLPHVEVVSFGSLDFVNPADIRTEDKEQARLALAAGQEAMLSGKYDMVVLDEINVAVAFGLLPLAEVIKLIQDKPPQVELILTGRKAAPELIKAADLVTECLKIKHPYDRGVGSRQGIEY
jgi:cob(I)alamin adenosyltransferase